MSDWTEQLCDHHDRLRRERVAERMLVLFEVSRLPEGGAVERGARLIEAWRWFQNQPGTGAAIWVREDPGGAEGAVRALEALGNAHGLRVPVDRFCFGEHERGRFGRAGWSCVAHVTDEGQTAQTYDGALALTGIDELTEPLEARVPELSWQGLATREDRDAFLGSTAAWCDLPLRAGGPTGIETAHEEGLPVDLEDLLGELAQVGKGVRLVLTEGGALVGRVVRLLDRAGFPTSAVRLLASYDTLDEPGFTELAAGAGSVGLECTVDYLGRLLRADPAQVAVILSRLRGHGVQRLSVRGDCDGREALVGALRDEGFEVDVRGLGTLRALLSAVDQGVRSMATDFGLAQRPTLRHSVDAALGQSPPVSRQRPRLQPQRRTASGRPTA